MGNHLEKKLHFRVESAYIFLRRILSVSFLLFYFLFQGYLFLNTEPHLFDFLEFVKFFVSLSLMFFFAALNYSLQTLLLKLMIYTLFAHIFVAMIAFGFNFFDSFTYDNRLVLSFLGRSPGATAQMFCVALVAYDCYLRDRFYFPDGLVVVFRVVAVVVVLLTQARTYYAFLLIYFSLSYWRELRAFFGSLKGGIVSSVVIVSVYAFGFLTQIVERSLGGRLFTGRDEIWGAFVVDFVSRDTHQLLFGGDLSRKLIYADRISYITSDVHNTFLDILNYYGVVFLLLFTVWYIFSSGMVRSRKAFILLLSYLPVLMLSSVFKFPYAVYSSVLMLMFPIYLSGSRFFRR